MRPTSTTYPNGPVLTYSYGTSNGIDDASSRVAGLIDDDGTTHLADYSYLGDDTFVEVDYTEPDVKYTLPPFAAGRRCPMNDNQAQCHGSTLPPMEAAFKKKLQCIARAVLCIVVLGGCNTSESEREWTRAVASIRDGSPDVRAEAADTLIEIGWGVSRRSRTEQQRSALREQLMVLGEVASDRSEAPGIRAAAVRSLGYFNEDAQHVVPRLLPVLLDESDDALVRGWIAMVLPEIGPQDEIGPAILVASGSSNEVVRVNASQQLGRLRLDNKVVVDWAVKAMDSSNRAVRLAAVINAARAYENSGDEKAMSVLLRAMDDPDGAVRDSARMLMDRLDGACLHADNAELASLFPD